MVQNKNRVINIENVLKSYIKQLKSYQFKFYIWSKFYIYRKFTIDKPDETKQNDNFDVIFLENHRIPNKDQKKYYIN